MLDPAGFESRFSAPSPSPEDGPWEGPEPGMKFTSDEGTSHYRPIHEALSPPSPVRVTDEAVEAAAKAFNSFIPDPRRRVSIAQARAALEAAVQVEERDGDSPEALSPEEAATVVEAVTREMREFSANHYGDPPVPGPRSWAPLKAWADRLDAARKGER